MELYTLRLGAPLSWNPVTTAPAEAEPRARSSGSESTSTGLALPALSTEGSEAVFIWSRDQLVVDSGDGPRISLPLPPPLQSGISEGSGDGPPQSSKIELPAGSYLFCQGRLSGIASIGQTLEWFFREVWWTRAEYRGPVYLRLIREDGKTAIQVIIESWKPISPGSD